MNVPRIAVTLLATALLFAPAAMAKHNNKGTLRLTEKVTVEGKSLNPGNYAVEWDGTGPTVQVSLLQGKETVATFRAQVAEQATANSEDAFGAATEPDGSKELMAIYLGGKRFFLEVEQNQTNQ